MTVMKCPECRGRGETLIADHVCGYHRETMIPCDYCDGTGEQEVTRCPWCGLRGLDFDEAPMPSTTCDHREDQTYHPPPMNSYAAWLAVRAQIEGRE